MAFTDLPDDWSVRPITAPDLTADVLDLLVSDADRRAGALLLALCDADERLVQPVVIDDLPSDATDGHQVAHVAGLLAGLGRERLAASVLVALARPGSLELTPADQRFCVALEEADLAGVRLLGVHVVTPMGSRPVSASG